MILDISKETIFTTRRASDGRACPIAKTIKQDLPDKTVMVTANGIFIGETLKETKYRNSIQLKQWIMCFDDYRDVPEITIQLDPTTHIASIINYPNKRNTT